LVFKLPEKSGGCANKPFSSDLVRAGPLFGQWKSSGEISTNKKPSTNNEQGNEQSSEQLAQQSSHRTYPTSGYESTTFSSGRQKKWFIRRMRAQL
jgi:hypothetical protein